MTKSKRARRAGLAAGAAALATMAFGASSASAAPFTTEFNYGYADLGPSFQDVTLLDGVNTATVSGDETAGVISAGTLSPIDRTLTLPIPGATAQVQIVRDPATAITGTYVSGTGATVLNATLDITVTVAGAGAADGSCTYNDVVYAFDTAGTVPHNGEPYDNPGGLGGVGAVSDSGTLPAGTPAGATCATLSSLLGADPDEVDLWLGSDMLPADSPVPFNQAFPQAQVNVGLLQNLDASAANARFQGTVQGDGGGASTADVIVPPGQPATATSPGFHWTPFATAPTGTPLLIDLILDGGGITAGVFDAANGAMTLPGVFDINVDVNANSFDCNSEDNALAPSTENPKGTAPAAGTRLTGLGGSGALAVSWAGLDQDGAAQCGQIDAAGFGPIGGLWLGRGITPPVAPVPPADVPIPAPPVEPGPTTKKCKKGQKLKKGKCVKKKKKKKKKKK